jgi:hypothetical protein
MEISWTDCVTNEEVLRRAKEEKIILQIIKRRKATWIDHVLCRNCLQKHVTGGKIEGMVEVTERRGRRLKQLQNDLKKGHWRLKGKALDRTVWRTRFGGGYGPVLRQTTE